MVNLYINAQNDLEQLKLQSKNTCLMFTLIDQNIKNLLCKTT